ncbi:MAG TPA: BatA domain-containing protein, partial [Saprospiraceae bacterium]|nr:BatA domain-containing protein [Saprospiraceae bacterium]
MALEIGSIAFHQAWVLLLLPLLWYFIYYIRRKKTRQSGLYIPTLRSVMSIRSLKTTLLPRLPWLRYAALSLLLIALARPQKILKEEIIKSEGIDICMVI